MHTCVYIYMYICIHTYLSIYLYVYLYLCLYIYIIYRVNHPLETGGEGHVHLPRLRKVETTLVSRV